LEKSLLQKNSLLAAFVVLFAITSHGASIGEFGGSYLRQPVGSRGLAMGGAQTAAPQVHSIWNNTAAIPFLKKRELALGGEIRPFGRTGAVLSIEAPIRPRAGFALAVLYRGDPTLDNLYDEEENPIDNGRYSTISTKLGLSYMVIKKLAFGINVSVLFQKIPSDYFSDGSLVYSTMTDIGSLDFSTCYIPSKKLSYGLTFKNIVGKLDWNIQSYSSALSEMAVDTLPLVMTLGQQYTGSIADKPFIWNVDISGYVINSFFKPLRNNHLIINNGFEWKRWESFYFRAGLSDFELNSDLFNDSEQYGNAFSMTVSGGFMADVSKLMKIKNKSLQFGYALANEKKFAGVNQQLDVVFLF